MSCQILLFLSPSFPLQLLPLEICFPFFRRLCFPPGARTPLTGCLGSASPSYLPLATFPKSLLAGPGTYSPIMVTSSQLTPSLGILLGAQKGNAQDPQAHPRGHSPQLLTRNGGRENPLCKIPAQVTATVSQEALGRELKELESWVELGAPPLRRSDKPRSGRAGGR